MGSDLTPTNQPLCGFLVPWDVSIDTANTTAPEASAEAGRFVPDADTLLRLEADGTPDSSVSSIDVRVIRPGGTRPGTGGIAYRLGSGDTWKGREVESLCFATETTGITGAGTWTDLSIIPLADGKILAAGLTSLGAFETRVRAADGTWGSTVSITSRTTTTGTVVRAPDGSILAYGFVEPPLAGTASDRTLWCWRSSDSGATWTLQSQDALGQAFDTGVRRVVAAASGSQVAVWVTDNTGTNSEAWQFSSVDGGYNFEQVNTSAETRATVWDAVYSGGRFHVLTTQYDGSANDELWYRGIGSSLSEAWGGTGIVLDSTYDHATLATVAVGGDGTIWVARESTFGVAGYRSTDFGVSFTAAGGQTPGPTLENTTTSGTEVDEPRMAFMRGRLHMLYKAGTVLCMATFGQRSDRTISGDCQRFDLSWVAEDTFDNKGWTNGDTGTPTRTLTQGDLENWTTAGGEAGQSTLTYAPSSGQGAGARVVYEVNSGNAAIELDVNQTQVRVDMNATQIRAYDGTGAAPAWVTHGLTGPIEFIVLADDTDSAAQVYYRSFDPVGDAEWTDLADLSGMANTGAAAYTIYLESSASSDVDWHEVHAGIIIGDPALSEGFTSPTDLYPVPLTSAFSWLTSGVSVRLSRGIGVVDGTTHTMTPDSPYRLENVLPHTAPSPRYVYRTIDTATTPSIRFSLPHETRPKVIGVYVDGIVGFGGLAVVAYAGGSPVATFAPDFRYQPAYDSIGPDSVIGADTGADADAYYLRANEAKGWHWENDDGTISRIAGNTAGTLNEGTTVDAPRAILHLTDGNDGAAAGTGVIYPSRALILVYLDGDTDVDQIALTATSTYASPLGYYQIGTVAIGEVRVLGRAPDLGDTLVTRNASRIQTMDDGQRYTSRRHDDRLTLSLSYVDSPHDIREVLGVETSPSYVLPVTDGVPTAARYGVPVDLRGIYETLHDDDVPGVWVPVIPPQAAGTSADYSFGFQPIYGRFTSDLRWEHVPAIGKRGESRMVRVTGIEWEEEL